MEIKLDLREFDLDAVKQAVDRRDALNLTAGVAHSCKYSAPCVIGALMTEEQREYLFEIGRDQSSIASLVDRGTVTFADSKQAAAATQLQILFDADRDFDEIAQIINEVVA